MEQIYHWQPCKWRDRQVKGARSQREQYCHRIGTRQLRVTPGVFKVRRSTIQLLSVTPLNHLGWLLDPTSTRVGLVRRTFSGDWTSMCQDRAQERQHLPLQPCLHPTNHLMPSLRLEFSSRVRQCTLNTSARAYRMAWWRFNWTPASLSFLVCWPPLRMIKRWRDRVWAEDQRKVTTMAKIGVLRRWKWVLILVGGQKEGFHEGERCVKRSKYTMKAKCTVSLAYSNLLWSTDPLAPMLVRVKKWLLKTKHSRKSRYIYTKVQHHTECNFRGWRMH